MNFIHGPMELAIAISIATGFPGISEKKYHNLSIISFKNGPLKAADPETLGFWCLHVFTEDRIANVDLKRCWVHQPCR